MNQWMDILGHPALALMAGDGGGAPPFLQARSAAQVESILGASPSHLVHYDEASGTANDSVGALVFTATDGATRVASAIMGSAGRVANNSAQYWASANTSDLIVRARSFAMAGVLTFTGDPSAELMAWFQSQSGVAGYGIAANVSRHFIWQVFEPTSRKITIATSHNTGAFGFIVGRHNGDLKYYAQTTIGSGELAIGSAVDMNFASHAAIPGRHQTDAGAANCVGADMDGWAWFWDTEAETLLANRATAVGKLLR